MYDLFDLAIIFIPYLVTMGLLCFGLFALHKQFKEKDWWQKLNTPRSLGLSLLILILFGFYFLLDYTLQRGCIIWYEDVLASANVVYCGISFLLVSLWTFLPFRKLASMILILELGFTLYKIFWVKEGYAVGFAGIPDPAILLYDNLGLLLRFYALYLLLRAQFHLLFIPAIVLILLSARSIGISKSGIDLMINPPRIEFPQQIDPDSSFGNEMPHNY